MTDQLRTPAGRAYDYWFYNATDPQNNNFPFGTTLLYRVAERSGDRFEEGERILRAAFTAGYEAGVKANGR